MAEEVGFDKIRRQQAQLSELRFVILDGARIAHSSPGIGQVCPSTVELDLSRNLFEEVGTVVDICSELKLLRLLRLK